MFTAYSWPRSMPWHTPYRTMDAPWTCHATSRGTTMDASRTSMLHPCIFMVHHGASMVHACTCMVHPRFVLGPPMCIHDAGVSVVHPWRVHGTSMVCSWCIHGTSTMGPATEAPARPPRIRDGAPMVHPWHVHQQPRCLMVNLWQVHGASMAAHCVSMAHPWFVHRLSRAHLHCASMLCPWGVYRLFTVHPWS